MAVESVQKTTYLWAFGGEFSPDCCELRVDRIWEGTSEIQRLIIANGHLKRGLPELAAEA